MQQLRISKNPKDVQRQTPVLPISRNHDDTSLSFSGMKDDSIAKLIQEQKHRQKQFNSIHRLSQNFVQSQNIDGSPTLLNPSSQQLSLIRQQSQTLKTPQFITKPVSSSINPLLKIQHTRQYEEGYNKGLEENLLNRLSSAFNDLEKYLSPQEIKDLKTTAGTRALQQSYYLNDQKKAEWDDFWVLHCLTFCIQFVFIIAGLLINIYWRYETTSRKKESLILQILRNHRCDIAFCLFFIIEYFVMIEFLLKSSDSQQYILLFLNFGIRINSISVSYASVLHRRRFLFLIFGICIFYLPLRSEIWRKNVISIFQMTLSVVTLTAICFVVRFRFQERVENVYQGIIILYRNIISNLCIRLQSKSLNNAENAIFAREISAMNRKLNLEKQPEGFLKKTSLKDDEGKKSEPDRDQGAQQISRQSFEAQPQKEENNQKLKEEFYLQGERESKKQGLDEKRILQYAGEICNGFCMIDDKLNIIGGNNQFCELLQRNSQEECLKTLMFIPSMSKFQESPSHNAQQKQEEFINVHKQQQKQYQLIQIQQSNEEDNLEEDANFDKELKNLILKKRESSQQKYQGNSTASTTLIGSNIDLPILVHQSNSYISGNSKQYEKQVVDSGIISQDQTLHSNKRISLSLINSVLNPYSLTSFLKKNIPLYSSHKTIPFETFRSNFTKEDYDDLTDIVEKSNFGKPSLILQEILRISAFVSKQEFDEQSAIINGKQRVFQAKYYSSVNQALIHLRITLLPLFVSNKLIFLINVSDQSIEVIQDKLDLHSSIIRGVADEAMSPIQAIIAKIKEARPHSKPEYTQTFLDPLLIQATYLLNYIQIFNEITPFKFQNDFDLILTSQSIQDFLLEEVSANFFDEAKSRGINLLVNVDNSAPSVVQSDFLKIKYVLTAILEQFLLHGKEGFQILIEARNSFEQLAVNINGMNKQEKVKSNKKNIIEFSVSAGIQIDGQTVQDSPLNEQAKRRLLSVFYSNVGDFFQRSKSNSNKFNKYCLKSSLFSRNTLAQKYKRQQRLTCLQIAFLIAEKLQPQGDEKIKTNIPAIQLAVKENGFLRVSFSVEDKSGFLDGYVEECNQKQEIYKDADKNNNLIQNNDNSDSQQVKSNILEEVSMQVQSSTDISQRDILNRTNNQNKRVNQSTNNNIFNQQQYLYEESFSLGDEGEVKESENGSQLQPRSLSLHCLPIPKNISQLGLSLNFQNLIQSVSTDQPLEQEEQILPRTKQNPISMNYIEEENTSQCQRSSSSSQTRKPNEEIEVQNLSFGTFQEERKTTSNTPPVGGIYNFGQTEMQKLYQNNNQISFSCINPLNSNSPKDFDNMRIPQNLQNNSISNCLQKKQMLFASSQSFYHEQFQQSLQQFVSEGQTNLFDSVFSIIEFAELLKQQYLLNNRFQYPFIFIDCSLVSTNNCLDEILLFFQQNNVRFESSMFLLSNSNLDLSIQLNYQYTDIFFGILPKQVTYNNLLSLGLVLWQQPRIIQK